MSKTASPPPKRRSTSGPTSANPPAGKTAKRRKRLERADDLPALQLTERDITLVDWIYQLRAATTDQLQRLAFPATAGASLKGRMTHCQYRLKLLYHHGYVTRDERPTRLSDGRQPLVYFPDKKGIELLAAEAGVEPGALDWRPRDNTAKAGHFFLEHLLATNEVRIALLLALEAQGLTLVRWLDDRTLRRREMKEHVVMPGEGKVAIVPDGFFQVETKEGKVFSHFLEADRRTVVGVSSKSGRRDWARKVRAYSAFYESGQYGRRYNAEQFRVLTVTTGPVRLANLKAITEEAGGGRRFWFTTYEQLTSETAISSPIWSVAGSRETYALLA